MNNSHCLPFSALRWFLINPGKFYCTAHWVWAPPCWLIKHCTVMDFWICLIWLPFFVFVFCLHRNKAILFYFNMLKCANPAVLINLQCPTTQVGDWTKPRFVALCTALDVSLSNFFATHDYARLMGALIKTMCCLPQLCVSKCPDRFATLLDAMNTKNWEYYKQFCKPGFEIGSKVRDGG